MGRGDVESFQLAGDSIQLAKSTASYRLSINISQQQHSEGKGVFARQALKFLLKGLEAKVNIQFCLIGSKELSSRVDKTTLNYVLEIRSAGPDGLPKNSDDIVVTRSKRHGESSLGGEAAKVTEEVAGGAASGIIKGFKKGLGDKK